MTKTATQQGASDAAPQSYEEALAQLRAAHAHMTPAARLRLVQRLRAMMTRVVRAQEAFLQAHREDENTER